MTDAQNWRKFATSLKAHPLADLFPMMGGKEYADLCGSIYTYGLLQPIVLDADNRIVDGRNRLRGCLDHNIEPRYVSFDTLDFDGDARQYIASINLYRRHLTDDQRVQIAALIYKDYREVAKAVQVAAGRGETPVNESVKGVPTAVKVAEAAKVSQHKAQQALKVAADAPELAPKVAAGEVKLAEAVKVAERKNPPKQRTRSAKVSVRKRTKSEKVKYERELTRTIDKAAHLAALVKTFGPSQAMRLALVGANLIARMVPKLQDKDRANILELVQRACSGKSWSEEAAAPVTFAQAVAAAE